MIRNSDIGLYQRINHDYEKKNKIAVCTAVCEKIAPEILGNIQRPVCIRHTWKQQDIKDPILIFQNLSITCLICDTQIIQNGMLH